VLSFRHALDHEGRGETPASAKNEPTSSGEEKKS
jgi:hypothetical protein